MNFTSVVNNALLGAGLVGGSSPSGAFGPAPGGFAFVDPFVVPIGTKGPAFPGITFPPAMFPAGGQGIPPVVTLGHPTVSFP